MIMMRVIRKNARAKMISRFCNTIHITRTSLFRPMQLKTLLSTSVSNKRIKLHQPVLVKSAWEKLFRSNWSNRVRYTIKPHTHPSHFLLQPNGTSHLLFGCRHILLRLIHLILYTVDELSLQYKRISSAIYLMFQSAIHPFFHPIYRVRVYSKHTLELARASATPEY